VIAGSLLTEFYLREGLRETPEWRALDAAQVAQEADALRALWQALAAMARPNEATTEQAFIRPVFDRLGWHHLPQQAAGGGRRDIPDALLFTTGASRDQAAAIPAPGDRYRLAAVVVENEARDTPLDRGSGKGGTPASQILRYLALAEPASGGAVRWGLLTNGRIWRLYYHGARSRAEGFVGFNLPALLDGAAEGEAGALDLFRAFLLLFRRDAHDRTGPGGLSFLDAALAEGRRYEQRITAALSEAVFDRVFPRLVAALAQADPQARPADPRWRAEAREAALILLYRLLFILYAEDRDLLPVRHAGYAAYALRRLRLQAAEARDQARPLSTTLTRWWDDLAALCRAIDAGDASLGLPPYNGGLFSASAAPLLARARLADATMGELLDDLSREGEGTARRLINFRDLSVQHLGSIYERLLEFDVVAEGGGVGVRLNAFARKNTGSYYTPEELVRLIIRRAVGPLLDERRAAFREAAERLASDRRPKEQRLAELRRLDPAEAFLSLRVLDPAMGSGHFLVSLVDWLTDETLAAQQEAAALTPWGEYASPLSAKIEAIRGHIREQARAHGWEVRDEHLDDRHLVRRIVLKRVIYGADLNPMAVELAKLSLWLHSFTVGAPLSFLDHHLRAGDSLFGEFVHQAEERIRARGSLLIGQAVVQARQAARGMTMIEELTDADIAEVRQSAATFGGVEEATRPLSRFLDFIHATRWLEPDLGQMERQTLDYLLDGELGDPVKVIAEGKAERGPKGTQAMAERLMAKARGLAEERRFQHWEVAFPGVWEDWESSRPRGGFDAVIGNPPWDKVEVDDASWFRAHAPEFARRETVPKREIRAAITRAAHARSILWREFCAARDRMHRAIQVARSNGAFPFTSAGRADLFALFVERGIRLLRPGGRLGLLVPTGLVADRRTAPFFVHLATTGRVIDILDFENRLGPIRAEARRTTPTSARGQRAPRRMAVRSARARRDAFFPDVHKSFKFAAFVAAADERSDATMSCAFFLSAEDIDRLPERLLSIRAADFAAVNPNTGTAATFRHQRDADITIDLHRRFPIVQRTDGRTAPAWPIDYSQMFNMRTDRGNGTLRKSEELDAAGFYRVAGGFWRRAEIEYVPLLVGRMIHHYDHRFAAVEESEDAEENDAVGVLTTPQQHSDPHHAPDPQFWVPREQVPAFGGLGWLLAYRDIARTTDARTAIATVIPRYGAGHTLPVLPPNLPASPGADAPPLLRAAYESEVARAVAAYRRAAPLVLANFNSLALDFVARQKVQTTHLSFFIVQQLPVIPLDAFARQIGTTTAETMIRDHVLRLSYTAHDLKAFAEDLGYHGPPFPWDAEERLHLRARLDALFFLLYGLDRDAADYILGTFPIVREEEERQFAGRFRSRDLILGYMAAFAAGDAESRIAA
jgi:hypothetical protein